MEENKKITSWEIKTALIHNLILKKGMIAATEVSYMMFQADVLAYPKYEKNKLLEIEVKISKSDLSNDFKKKEMKHKLLLSGNDNIIKELDIPNYFYFAIPFELIDSCQQILKEQNKLNYGIMVYSDYGIIKNEQSKWVLTNKKIDSIKDRILIIKPARKIFTPDIKVSSMIERNIFFRLMYQQCNYLKEKYFHVGGWDSPDTIAKLKKEVKYAKENQNVQIKDLTFMYWNALDIDLKIEIDKILVTKWSSYCKFNKIMSILQRQKERKENENS